MQNGFYEKSDEEVDAGFDFIMQYAPKSVMDLTQLRWRTKALADKDGPIYQWPIPLVTEALRALGQQGALAKKETQWYITLMDMQPWVLDSRDPFWH